MTDEKFSLEHFEQLCYSRQHEAAARELIRLLLIIDRHYGKLSGQFVLSVSPAISATDLEAHVLTRITSAITTLFSDPGFQISPTGFDQLINFQRWLSSLFAASAFVNADHILRALNLYGGEDGRFEVAPTELVKFCVLYSSESQLPLDVELLWQQNRNLTVALCMALLSPRFLGTPAAHSKREALLAWLPERLDSLDSLDQLPVAIIHDVYMHCSYADLPQRHRIKRSICRLVERKLANNGIDSLPITTPRPAAGKPKMLVVLEWFSGGHSIYRTHSRTLEAARQHFDLHAVGYASNVDDLGRAVFDAFTELSAPNDLLACVRQVRELAAELQPQVLYMPSVGMFPLTLFVANLRLAPLQVAALGHPATTGSRHIDYISVEEDFLGDPACFDEKLLLLPSDGQPYRPSAIPIELSLPERTDTDEVAIAIAATTMKLNPRFLQACQQIAQLTQRHYGKRVRFHFLIGQAQGLLYPQLQRLIRRYLPDARIYPHQPYQDYLGAFSRCDLFLSPFPFGNTNGIIDALTVGLPGVCKTGAEVFEHIDEGMLRRAGLPDWLITDSIDDYIIAAARLAGDFTERQALYDYLADGNALQRLFAGRAEVFGERLLERLSG
ncbi:peptide transporter [Ectopseudomonas composti]|uniref:Peptide transporter n=1 Tax=Ectopseudomonas composti TaxID=658457 RepID=A0ABN0SC66_9GAMM|nr:peptide transporter [Pseudomonas composti]EZH80386.1 peptide transporter [Pseudomonas composti]